MNANEIMDGLEKEVLKKYGEGHSCQERNVLREAIQLIDENQKALSRCRIRDTATEPPTRKDGDGEDCLLVFCNSIGWILARRKVAINNPEVYVKWTQLPEVE